MAAAAPIRPLAWELPYVSDAALKIKEKKIYKGAHGVKHFSNHRTVGGLGEQQTQPEVCIDGGCLVFRCSLFMRLGVLESLPASTSGSLANELSDFKPQFPHP